MQLLKMELRGFKSFADKTTIVFDKGITAVVGPNGSGKSNISDAVRWVMGEQNVRQLRGQKAEDIIFAGTATRRPQGAAEVSLYFDNTDHALDIEFTEVVVTRRLFRSGESEFYINKRPCRLKDIHVLFADTGIGQDSMAVIGQNRVDRILNSKPEERRIIFEEVAGISRYKSRKEEGLRKIAETERNLERIRDMMSMLEERLEPMAAEAEKLKRFRAADRERISYEGTLTLQELRNYERLVARAENSRATYLAERDQAGAAITAAERERDKLVAAMELEGQELRRLDEEALRAHQELESLLSRREALEQRQKESVYRREELAAEGQTLTQKKAEQEQQLAARQKQQEQQQRALAAAKQSLAWTHTLLEEAVRHASDTEKRLAEGTAAQAKSNQELFVCRHECEDLRRRLDENSEQCTRYRQTWEQAKKQCHEQRQLLDSLQQDIQEKERQQQCCQDAWHTAKDMLDRHSQELAAAEKTWAQLKERSAMLEQRIRVLASMEQEHEGVGRAAKMVLDAQTPWRARLPGIVGELCTIPREVATAVDMALGGAVRYIVAEDEAAARQAIAYLTSRKGGRTTFLPLDTIQVRRRTEEEERAAREKGSLGFASDLIQYEKTYEPVFLSLLGKTIVVRTAEEGARIAGAYRHRLRLVCLDGTLFNPGGSLTGGSSKNAEGSFISRRVLLQELREQESRTKADKEKAAAAALAKRQQAETCRQTLQEQEKLVQKNAAALQQQQWQAGQIAQTLEQTEKQAAGAEQTYRQCGRIRESIQASLAAAEERLEHMQAEPSEDMSALQAEASAAQKEAERCRSVCTEQEVAAATLQEQVRQQEEQIARYTQWIEETQADMSRWRTRQDALAQELKDMETMRVQLDANAAAKQEETQQCDAAKEAFYAAKEKNFQARNKLEAALDELRREEQQWRERLNTADVQLEKYHAEVRRSEERLNMQGLTRQQAMERRREGSMKELHARVAALQKEISELGTINPNAETEYRAAVEKAAFYRTQCDDLKESQVKLEHIVADIDTAMASQFIQAFRQIEEHFQQIFGRLFGGGAAHLVLTDVQHVLTAGVHISIQPTGKKEQPLSLLSGGERALTVIALLLAFLAYHPAPFCLVDEVDAALDEANVERMAQYLKRYSGQTQFIVITHRRKTMEAAHTLQGVTMEEKGVSRLLTVKINDVLEKGT